MSKFKGVAYHLARGVAEHSEITLGFAVAAAAGGCGLVQMVGVIGAGGMATSIAMNIVADAAMACTHADTQSISPNAQINCHRISASLLLAFSLASGGAALYVTHKQSSQLVTANASSQSLQNIQITDALPSIHLNKKD